MQLRSVAQPSFVLCYASQANISKGARWTIGGFGSYRTHTRAWSKIAYGALLWHCNFADPYGLAKNKIIQTDASDPRRHDALF